MRRCSRSRPSGSSTAMTTAPGSTTSTKTAPSTTTTWERQPLMADSAALIAATERTRYPLRRYAALWRGLFGLAWRRMPREVVLPFAGNVVLLAVVAGTALALRWTVDATVHGRPGSAVLGA